MFGDAFSMFWSALGIAVCQVVACSFAVRAVLCITLVLLLMSDMYLHRLDGILSTERFLLAFLCHNRGYRGLVVFECLFIVVLIRIPFFLEEQPGVIVEDLSPYVVLLSKTTEKCSKLP